MNGSHQADIPRLVPGYDTSGIGEFPQNIIVQQVPCRDGDAEIRYQAPSNFHYREARIRGRKSQVGAERDL